MYVGLFLDFLSHPIGLSILVSVLHVLIIVDALISVDRTSLPLHSSSKNILILKYFLCLMNL
jgi:hypothetical protein